MAEHPFLLMLRDHPDALDSRQRFSGLLMDYYPREPAMVQMMAQLYDMGLQTEIQSAGRITRDLAAKALKRLMDEHGAEAQAAKNAIGLFCVCYGRDVLGKPCDLGSTKAASRSPSAPEAGPGGDAQNHEEAEVWQGKPYDGPVVLLSTRIDIAKRNDNVVNVILQRNPEDHSKILVQAQVHLTQPVLAQIKKGAAVEFWATMSEPNDARWKLKQ